MSDPAVGAAGAGTITIGGDLTVNRLGFGAMRITGRGIWGDPPDREAAKAVLRRAVELGVNFIDTADSYGPEVSEELIAEALHPYPDDLVIATKGGLERPGPDQWTPNGRPEHLRKACEGSLRRLRLERIPLYQFHRPDPQCPARGVDRHPGRAQRRRARSATSASVERRPRSSCAQAQALTPIVSVQNRYNVADRGSESLVDLCASRSASRSSRGRRSRTSTRDRPWRRSPSDTTRPRRRWCSPGCSPARRRCCRSPARRRSRTSRRTSPPPRSSLSDDEIAAIGKRTRRR